MPPFTAPVRTKLYPGEIEFFKKNLNTTGMAADDNSVILNPYSKLNDESKQSVIRNETARIFMRTNEFYPQFDLTPEQKETFKEYPKYTKGNNRSVKETIAARALSGDSSAGILTPEQQQFVESLRYFMGW